MRALVLVTLLYALRFMSLICVTAKEGDIFKVVILSRANSDLRMCLGCPRQPLMSIRLELERCTSYCNPKYCNISAVCRPLNRTSKLVSTDIYFHPGVKLEAPIYLKIATFMKFATVYRPFMVNYKTELCKELLLRTYPLIFGIANCQSDNARFLDPCPLKGHRSKAARISNLYEYVSTLLPIVPAGEWRADIIVSVQRNGSEVIVFSWNDYYEVKVLTAEEF